MNSIYIKEEEVIRKAKNILELGVIETEKDEILYREILMEFENLLDQTKRLVKMSDIIERKLNNVRISLDEISKVDFVTKLYNRHFFNELIIKEWKSCARNKCFLALLMIDIDKFKAYNDKYDHIQGDKCLESVSKCIKEVINRPRDIVARYGGEEFVVLLPETNLKGAKHVAEKIRKSVEKLQIIHEDADVYRIVTISVGVAVIIPNDKISTEKLISTADKALYRAKRNGKNRVEIENDDQF